ncbi:16S rRNA (guanine(527)-N(7))-methyltransferase RsmG [Shimazuella sp. AN120528]|uniref:16S rRNA (guanine(527)-N(7))-methyltransferase RsmG n=1 Tax=Shimazuella soli TaxID=1892854 RepID=UPI001F0F6313|nr:16S rRNA (guanine(527)-N(7))-methyltransferase RsmG [Shimazuella soli]MCH5585044.1 16S rRNA (guanine(527)-N(7))-methyltransferase RsmG [Shimazuella soli]
MRSYLQNAYELNDTQLEQFETYYRLLVEKNKVMNLTAITDRQEVDIKHFFDSLTISRVINFHEVNNVMDVGTGAGFPGIPLKIAFPHLHVTLLDSLQKRIFFLQEVGEALGLDKVEYIHGRAEDIAKDHYYRERYDVVTSRAVARLNILAEYCLPFTSVGGTFVAMKAGEVEQEVANAKQALALLGKVSQEIYPLNLPEEMGERKLVILTKKQSTPKKYPRNAGTIKKSPLGGNKT